MNIFVRVLIDLSKIKEKYFFIFYFFLRENRKVRGKQQNEMALGVAMMMAIT